MKKLSILLLIVFISVINSNAQLKYRSNGTLTLGNVDPVGLYKTNFEGYGFYYSRLANSTYLEVCLGATAPRMAGSLDQVVFYNTETATFNSLQAANYYQMSDRKAKTDITPLNFGLDKVKELNPVSFNWKKGDKNLRKATSINGRKELGFIAQDVEEILPEAVITDEEGTKLLNYATIVAVLTRSVQELSAQVDSLKSQLSSLKISGNAASLGDAKFSKGSLSRQPQLFQNTPNPFTSQASIQYSIPKINENASITIYDMQGRRKPSTNPC